MATTDPLIAAERAFASAAASDGTRSAFLQFLADDSILFRPGPVNGKTWFQTQPANPGLLSWWPAFAEIAACGDLGYTTGPWNFRNDSDGDPVQFGQYVSIWQGGPRTPWQVVMDAGITCPPWEEKDKASEALSVAHELTREGVSDSELLKVESLFLEQVRDEGFLAAFQRVAAANVWVLRMGQTPMRGHLDLAESLPVQPLNIEWNIAGASIAASGDLGYVYGTGHRISAGQSEERYSFLRIWRWSNQDGWELALDMDNPFPAGT